MTYDDWKTTDDTADFGGYTFTAEEAASWDAYVHGFEAAEPTRPSRRPTEPAPEEPTCDCGAPIDPSLGVSMCRECYESCTPVEDGEACPF